MQATSRRTFIVSARFISQAKPYITYIGKVVVENVFIRVIHISFVSIVSPVLHIHIFFVYHRHYVILAIHSLGI